MLRVGIRELKNKLSDYIRKIDKGETIVITYHNKDIAMIEPIEPFGYKEIYSLIKEKTVSWEGSKPANINEPVKTKKAKMISDIISGDRR
ncbi:MAG: type II toxin-antitoxin system prevent-host-death family antitoxin [Actinobacteria bacterium]|nr:type II toxin-antitoxin system prevent-host-death family antitoxin [Actinomycetota bacterium]